MKIAIIGPGIMDIPPKGWGAVEVLIEDYRAELTRLLKAIGMRPGMAAADTDAFVRLVTQ